MFIISSIVDYFDKRATKGTRNEASQTVVGTVYDLKRLEAAQTEILSISARFNGTTAERKIAAVIASVEPLRTQVQIFDAGCAGAGSGKYAFVATSRGGKKTLIR